MRYCGDEERKIDYVKKPKNKIIPSTRRGAKLREELLSKIIPWEEITVSLDDFPYFIDERTKSLLKECASSHLKQNALRKYGARLNSSNQKILLQSMPGTELCRERLVSALARELKVPLLKLDDEHGWDYSDEERDVKSQRDDNDENRVHALKIGDRVYYNGRKDITFKEVNNRTLSWCQGGEVYEVSRDRVAVAFNICGLRRTGAENDGKNAEMLQKAIVTWFDANEVKPVLRGVRKHDCIMALEALFQVLESQKPMIVYFSDSFLWPPPHYATLNEVDYMFNQLLDGVVMICPKSYWKYGVEDKEDFPKSLQEYIEESCEWFCSKESEIYKLFTNFVCIKPLMDEALLNALLKQIEKDRLTMLSEANLKTMQKVLEDHNLSCLNLERPNFGDMTLTRQEAEKIVRWATNHCLSSHPGTCVNGEKVQIPQESIKLAISRLIGEKSLTLCSTVKSETKSSIKSPCSKKKTHGELATGEHEKSLIPAVVRPEDIREKFDDICAPDNVKKTLHETVVLPLKRPELFSHGNLLSPCEGVILFGPPGAGITAIAKAFASESGAYLINITSKTFTSMQPLALFSYAKKLAPVIIFLDEVVSLYHDENGESRLNEFIAAWDGLNSEESHRIIVIVSANRPFDLDEAVVCRIPIRLYVGPPNVKTRLNMLRVLLNKENLEFGFSFARLAEATEGYFNSDLKNLCVAAARRPLKEFVELESKREASRRVSALRAINLKDFIHSKAKVRPSFRSLIIELREWNEKYGAGGCREIQNCKRGKWFAIQTPYIRPSSSFLCLSFVFVFSFFTSFLFFSKFDF